MVQNLRSGVLVGIVVYGLRLRGLGFRAGYLWFSVTGLGFRVTS